MKTRIFGLIFLLSFAIPAFAQINLFNSVPATLTQISRTVTNPSYAQNGTLLITWAGITGSPSGCQFQQFIVDTVGNTIAGQIVAVTPASGSTTANWTGTPNYPRLQVTYSCTTYPTAGTLTLDYGPQVVITAGTGTTLGNGIITPSQFGAVGGMKFTYSAQYTSGSAVVNCSPGDCNFTSADVGKIVLCTNFSAYVNGGAFLQAVICPYNTTILSVQSVTQATLSNTLTSSCTPSFSLACGFAWAKQVDDAGLLAAAQAAWNTPGQCKQLFINDNFFFSQPIFNLTISQISSACGGQFGGAAISGIDSTQEGPMLLGTGPGTSVLIPYNFNTAGCTFSSGTSCNFTTPNLYIDKIGVNGLGQPLTGNPTVTLANFGGSTGGGACTGSTVTNSGFANWGVNDANAFGFSAGNNACGNPVYFNNVIEMFGGVPCVFTGGGAHINSNFVNNMCFGGVVEIIVMNPAGGILNIEGNFFAGLVGNGPVELFNSAVGGTINSRSNVYWNEFVGSSATGLFFTGTGTLNWNSDSDDIAIAGGNTGTSQAILSPGTGLTFSMKNTTITATGTNNKAISLSSGNTIFDLCPQNKILNGSVANIINGVIFGTCSSTGTTLTTGNVGLTSGWGTSTVTSASGDSHRMKFTVTAAGVPAANPVITITFPASYPIVAPNTCTVQEVSGTFGVITNPSVAAPTLTSVAITFSGTAVATQTYTFDVNCGA